MIYKLRRLIESYKDKKLMFKYNGSRNQIEEFIGYIDKVYSNVFTIKLDNNRIKTFSYNDVLIHKLVFKNANS